MSETSRPPARAEAVVDTDVIAANVASIRGRLARSTQLMIVVKADGYGHGMHAAAAAALAGGADWLGVATSDEALALRAGGIEAPALCWLSTPGEDAGPLVDAGIDITVSAQWRLDEVLDAVRSNRSSRPARVQLKVDTGLSRNGAVAAEVPALAAALSTAVQAGEIEFTGLWSHLACADEPGHPANDAQLQAFEAATTAARAAGLEVGIRHLANSAATLTRPDLHFDLVRVGIAAYGYPPVHDVAPDLRPAMTVRASLAAVKPVAAGSGVSYGHAWHAPADTVVGLVPLGYADGILRASSPGAWTTIGGRRAPVVGRICMDQFVVDLGPGATEAAGDEVVLFGPADTGAVHSVGAATATADDWAEAAGTISYEVVTGIRGRVQRFTIGAHAAPHSALGVRS